MKTFKFRIGNTEFEVAEPTVEDLKRTEIEVTAPYAVFLKDGVVPEGSQIDSLLVHTLAAVKKPKLTAAEVRKWPAKKWYALQMALAKTIDVNTANDVTFFPEPNVAGNDRLNARVQDVPLAGPAVNTPGVLISVAGSTIPAAGVQTSQEKRAGVRPRSVHKRTGGPTSQPAS